MAGPQRPESREGGLIRVAFCYGVGRSHAARVIPVAFYARLFVCLDVACNVVERDILARAEATQVTAPRGAWRDGDTSSLSRRLSACRVRRSPCIDCANDDD